MIRVQAEPFDLGAELAGLTAGRTDIGGLASFVGLVREFAREPGGEPAVSAMTLEHYPGMTERQLAAIEAQAIERFQLQASLIIHRYGRMLPGEPIVLVAAAAAHRAPALDACAFLIDWLKTKAPFWKQEETAAGRRWVDAKPEDDTAAARWLPPAR